MDKETLKAQVLEYINILKPFNISIYSLTKKMNQSGLKHSYGSIIRIVDILECEGTIRTIREKTLKNRNVRYIILNI